MVTDKNDLPHFEVIPPVKEDTSALASGLGLGPEGLETIDRDLGIDFTQLFHQVPSTESENKTLFMEQIPEEQNSLSELGNLNGDYF